MIFHPRVIVYRYLTLAIAALIPGLVIFSYGGWRIPFLRNYVGDFLAVIVLYATLSMVWNARPIARSTAVFALVAAVEVVQYTRLTLDWVMHSRPYGDFFVGTTFDWADILTYALAAVFVAVIDPLLIRRSSLTNSKDIRD